MREDNLDEKWSDLIDKLITEAPRADWGDWSDAAEMAGPYDDEYDAREEDYLDGQEEERKLGLSPDDEEMPLGLMDAMKRYSELVTMEAKTRYHAPTHSGRMRQDSYHEAEDIAKQFPGKFPATLNDAFSDEYASTNVTWDGYRGESLPSRQTDRGPDGPDGPYIIGSTSR